MLTVMIPASVVYVAVFAIVFVAVYWLGGIWFEGEIDMWWRDK